MIDAFENAAPCAGLQFFNGIVNGTPHEGSMANPQYTSVVQADFQIASWGVRRVIGMIVKPMKMARKKCKMISRGPSTFYIFFAHHSDGR